MTSLNKILSNVKPGEWIYIETYWSGRSTGNLKITNGFWSKFRVCVWDIFTGLNLARKTQETINQYFIDWEKGIKPDLLKKNTLLYLSHIREWNESVDSLSKIRLVWNRNFDIPKEVGALSPFLNTAYFDDQVNQMDQLIRILPRKLLSEEVKQALDSFELAFQELNELEKEGAFLKKSQRWVEIVDLLKKLKLRLSGFDKEDSNIYFWKKLSWRYRLGLWDIFPKSNILKTPGGHEKRIDYVNINFDFKKIVDEISSTENNYEKFIKPHIQQILNFFSSQYPSQRLPVSFIVSQFKSADWLDMLFMLSLNTEQGIVKALAQQLSNMLGQYPEYFNNKFSLYQEAKTACSETDSVDVGVCLSRITGDGAKKIFNGKKRSYIVSRHLRQDVKDLIKRLKVSPQLPKEHLLRDLDVDQPLNRLEEAKLLSILQTSELDTDCIITLKGKDLGCHKEIAFAAFPIFEPLEEVEKENRLNLDFIPFNIPENFEHWVLNSLVTYAYTREHPNLPLNSSKNAIQAYDCYIKYLDYLNTETV